MPDEDNRGPDSTALRVALWRAIHVQVDAPPHVWDDMVGLALPAPDEGWRRRPDMDIRGTSRFRASVVARARFVEELVPRQPRCSRSLGRPASERSGMFPLPI